MTSPADDLDPGQAYSDDTRAAVLAHYAETGSARRTAAHFGIHYQTLYRWAEEARQRSVPMRYRCCGFLLDITAPCPVCGRGAPAVLL